jgi:hypothetical protein
LWLIFSKLNFPSLCPSSKNTSRWSSWSLPTLLIHFQLLIISIQSSNIETDLRSPQIWISPNQLHFANQCHQGMSNNIRVTPIKYFGKIQFKVLAAIVSNTWCAWFRYEHTP